MVLVSFIMFIIIKEWTISSDTEKSLLLVSLTSLGNEAVKEIMFVAGSKVALSAQISNYGVSVERKQDAVYRNVRKDSNLRQPTNPPTSLSVCYQHRDYNITDSFGYRNSIYTFEDYQVKIEIWLGLAG